MFKIITAYNHRYETLANIVTPIFRDYCSYHKYQYQEYIISDNYLRPAPWAKIEYLLKEIDQRPNYYTLWIDSDAVILNKNIDLWSFVKPNKFLYLSKDHNNINSGVVLIKNHIEIKNLLLKAWTLTQYLNHEWWEQAALIDLITKNYNGINYYIEYIEPEIFNTINIEPTDKSFIAHLAGPFLERKEFYLKKYSKLYNR